MKIPTITTSFLSVYAKGRVQKYFRKGSNAPLANNLCVKTM